MSLYTEIKSFTNDETLLQIIKRYTSKQKGIAGRGLYYKIVHLEEDLSDEEHNKYEQEFYRNVAFPCYENIFRQLREAHKEDINDKHSILRFNTYYEALLYLNKYDDRIEEISNKYSWDDRDKARKEMQEAFSMDEKDVEFLFLLRRFRMSMKGLFNGGDFVMGFHVNPKNLSLERDKEREKDEIKFYINANSDTYRFARYFQEKCEKEGVNYYYKVANPTEVNLFQPTEDNRLDRMCIFCSFENAEKILKILKEVKNEHPDIKYDTLPLFSGNVDGWIGVGQDHITSNSFNHDMAEICEKVFDEEFKGIEKDKIMDTLRTRPELLQKIKAKIIKEAEAKGVDPNTMCTKKSDKAIIQNINMDSNNDNTRTDDLGEYIDGLKKHIERQEKLIAEYEKRYNELRMQINNSLAELETLRKKKSKLQ